MSIGPGSMPRSPVRSVPSRSISPSRMRCWSCRADVWWWRSTASDVDESTTLISWSMAKSMLQAVVGTLVLDGKLSVVEPVAAPEWTDPDDPRRRITVHDLLTMRPGLEWLEDYIDGEVSHVIEMLFGSGREDVASYAASLPPVAPPGERYVYSSGTSNILARFVGDRVGSGRDDTDAFLRRALVRSHRDALGHAQVRRGRHLGRLVLRVRHGP